MEYSKLISVTGLPGLYELIASKTDGAVVRSLEDKTTRFVSSRIHNFSHLESIEVYTEGDNVNLVDVFYAMQNSSENLPNEKDANAVKAYFKKVYPSMDFERVYASDMKKMTKWFEVLRKNEVEIKLTEEPVEEKEDIVAEPDHEEIKAEPKKTKAAKKTEKPGIETPNSKEKAAEPKKAKAAKAKKEEPVATQEDASINSEPKAAKKKITKK